jgi:glycosyltransferase involved in cell wall biosynthesis
MSISSPDSSHSDVKASPRLSVFEFSQFGHYPYYLRLLIEHCRREGFPYPVDLVITPRFAEHHAEVPALAEATPENQIRVHVLSEAEQKSLDEARTGQFTSLNGLLKGEVDERESAVRRWRLVAHHAERLGTAHALITHLDSCLLAVAAGLELHCPFSGILFRPTFHYPAPADYSESRLSKFQRLQERLLMDRMLKHPQLATLFCLDPTAVESLRAMGNNIEYLPDPVPPGDPDRDTSRIAFRRSLGIPHDRLMLLAFGDISERKGIAQLLEALELLRGRDCEQIALVFVGVVKSFDKQWLHKKIAALEARFPIILRTEYVAEDEVNAYFSASDLVLAPYQRHAGMSGVLLRAAAQGKPVLTQTYGVMGHLTREYGLGIAVETGDVSQIVLALENFIQGTMGDYFDPLGMRRLVAQHDERSFARTLLTRLHLGNA